MIGGFGTCGFTLKCGKPLNYPLAHREAEIRSTMPDRR